ncbi:MAG: translation initiation factor IF-2 N-terminal domain-containing protein, partial [Candidatus Omnitrophica bacterium]|nr:translation initiation factor IF-2 N-terminal domain-containing protein [Candidatus Omnitrophota bacterium]
MAQRVHQLAKDLGLSSKELIDKLAALKIDVKGHMSMLDDAVITAIREKLASLAKAAKPAKKTEVKKELKPEKKVHKTAAPLKETPKKEIKPVSVPAPVQKTGTKTMEAEKILEEVIMPPRQAPKTKFAEPARSQAQTGAPVAQAVPAPHAQAKQIIEMEYPVTVKALSIKLGIKAGEIITYLMKKSILATINQNIDE